MRPAGFLTVRVQRLRPDLLPRAPREPRVRRLRRDRLGDVRRVPALRREREARPGRRHPRHLRQARGVSPMRPLEAPGDDAAVPRPGMQRKTRRRERVQVQGVPRGGVPEAQIAESHLCGTLPPAGAGARDAAEPSNRREPIDRTEPTRRRSRGGDRRRLDRGSRPHADPSRGSGRVHVVRGSDAPPTKTTPPPAATRRTIASAPREICDACGRSFPHLAALIAHAEAEHAGGGGDRGAGVGGRRGGGAREVCPRGGRGFSDVGALVAHVESAHEGGASAGGGGARTSKAAASQQCVVC